MTKKPLVLLIFLLVSIAFLIGQPTLAQSEEGVYFPETGHWVTGDFLKTYQEAENPLLIYGYPITEAFPDATTGRIIQYFQRARFELQTDAPADLRVRLSPLGQYLYTPSEPYPMPNSLGTCRTFTETGHQVCNTFLDFFEANGGAAQFGYPISDFERHDGLIVQYFQRARFEWHPEYPAGERVRLTDLGSQYFDVRQENPKQKEPVAGDNAIASILDLRVRAFPKAAVTPQETEQTIYVVVQDQKQQAVPDAEVELRLIPLSGPEREMLLPATDENGITHLTFPFHTAEYGIVQVWVTASYGDLQAETVTSFRVWY